MSQLQTLKEYFEDLISDYGLAEVLQPLADAVSDKADEMADAAGPHDPRTIAFDDLTGRLQDATNEAVRRNI